MKKMLSPVFVICLLICVVQAFAEGSTIYHVDELGLNIAIPDELNVYVQGESNDGSLAETFGMTNEELNASMIEANTYILAFDSDFDYLIEIIKGESLDADYDKMSDAQLNEMISYFREVSEESGITVTGAEICRYDKTNFLKLHLTEPNNGYPIYSLMYYTSHDGKAIAIRLWPFLSELDLTAENMADKIVSSVDFDEELPTSTEVAEENAYMTVEGVSFSVPANWSNVPTIENINGYEISVFTCNDGLGVSFNYSAVDVWSTLPAAQKTLFKRSDINNSIFTLEQVARSVETREIDVKDKYMATFNGREYFCVEMTKQYEDGVELYSTELFYCENGYLFMFTFGDGPDSAYYSDFEALMNSVAYPEFE